VTMPKEDLIVLDIGEIVGADGVAIATFDPTEQSISSWEERIRRLQAYGNILTVFKAVRGCPHVAPWLARLPMDEGDGNVWGALQTAIAEAEGQASE
jgi:hypothetical protein